MQKQALKALLTTIKEHGYEVPQDIHPYELSLIMMEHIGDTDAELRDKLIYSTLYFWIDREVLQADEVYEIFKIALNEEHLFVGLGQVDDSVFSRVFSVLVIALSIMRHRKTKFIPEADIKVALDRVLKMYNEDRDVRGYVDGKGWAHGAAHGADALDEFARCEEIGYAGLVEILEAIYKKVNMNHYGYIHFEDERMITAVKAILERELIPIEEIENWVKRFKKIEKIGKYPEDLIIVTNVISFLKSLYFRLLDQPKYAGITKTIEDVLKMINPYSKM